MKKCKKLLPAIAFAVLTLFSALMTVTASAVGKYSVVVEDFDNCLTDDEERSLRDIMQKTADKIGYNIGYCITADLEGMTHQYYSDYRLDLNFGVSSDSVMLLMMNSHDKPEYYNATDEISTTGKARSVFNTSLIENKIFPRIYKGLDNSSATSVGVPVKNVYKGTSSAQYYQACVEYCKALEYYGGDISFFAKVGEYISDHVVELFMAIIAAIIIAFIATGSTKKKYSKKRPVSATSYLDKSSINQKRAIDAFVREYTTSVTVSSSSSHGGGGGHSSGHSGGGGRHR